MSVSCPQCLLPLHKLVYGPHADVWTLCGLTLCFVWLSCGPVLWTGWQRAGHSAGLGFRRSPTALSKDRRASPVRTYGRSPPKPSPFPQPHVGQNFGVKSHHNAEGPVPSWLPHPWRYDFAQQHLPTSGKFPWLFPCFWQAKSLFFAGDLLGIPIFPLKNVSLELSSLCPTPMPFPALSHNHVGPASIWMCWSEQDRKAKQLYFFTSVI